MYFVVKSVFSVVFIRSLPRLPRGVAVQADADEPAGPDPAGGAVVVHGHRDSVDARVWRGRCQSKVKYGCVYSRSRI